MKRGAQRLRPSFKRPRSRTGPAASYITDLSYLIGIVTVTFRIWSLSHSLLRGEFQTITTIAIHQLGTSMAWRRASVLAAVGLLCLLAFLSKAQAQRRGFAASCNSYEFGVGGILKAQCRKNSGQYVAASIDPNPHISNVDGHLVDGANFLGSCAPNGVETYELPDTTVVVKILATCPGKSGERPYHTSNYDISTKVTDRNGNLVWNLCHGRSLRQQ